MASYLNFSDAAKFADVARNLVTSGEYGASFRFWNDSVGSILSEKLFSAQWISPVTPLTIAFFSKFLGMNDIAVIGTSIFYYILTLIFVFLLSFKLYKSRLVSILSVLAVGFNYNIIRYALDGASEMPFMFEVLAATYFLSFKSKLGNILSIIVIVLLYFTRPQAIIYIFGLVMYYLVSNYGWKKGTIYTLVTYLFGTVLYLLFSRQGLIAVTQNLPGVAVSDSLRGSGISIDFLTLLKKLFYNLYNFYKAIPEIMNPYLFVLFVIGMFRKPSVFNIFVFLTTLFTFTVTALTIPFYRYLHPVVPLLYIVAVSTLVLIVSDFDMKLNWISKNNFVIVVSTFITFLLFVGQTLGILLLDSRFERKIHNVDKAPIYVEMSHKLKDVTNKDDIILTNLDTWGSWYGERKTVWFPLEPKMVLPYSDKINAIYLTSYKIDDENYYMGKEWREIFNNPESQKILPEYKFIGAYEFKAGDNYENQNGKAILLLRTHNE